MNVDVVIISSLYSSVEFVELNWLLLKLLSQRMVDCGKLLAAQSNTVFCPCIIVTFPSLVEFFWNTGLTVNTNNMPLW